MNEMDLKTKIEGLEKAIKEHKDFAGNFESTLEKTKQELKDYNKIALPPIVFDDIYEAIEEGINKFDWSDTDNYNIEYGIDYDGKVHCESFELSHNDDLVRMIVEQVSRLFTEADAPEDEPTADQINSTIQTIAEVVFDRNEELLDPMPIAEQCKSEVTEDKPSEEINETKPEGFRKRTWFSK